MPRMSSCHAARSCIDVQELARYHLMLFPYVTLHRVATDTHREADGQKTCSD